MVEARRQMGDVQAMKEESCESQVANLLAMMDEVECLDTKINLLSKAVAELQKQINELKVKEIVGCMKSKIIKKRVKP